MGRVAFILAAAVALCPVSIWAQGTGADAFADRDFAMARQLWQQEAAAGSPEAMLGLGLLADRGYGGQRDLDAAHMWYARAADLGLPEAQFNMAIIYDAGLGRKRDAEQALMWYSRAGLRGHARAQYNLGLLYETGDGVATNPSLASFWFDKAAQAVPAAAQKSIPAETTPDFLAKPHVSFAQNSTHGAELVWNAKAAASQTYLVEVVDVPPSGQNYAAPIVSQATVASGFLAEDTLVPANALWRVSNVSDDGTDYSASLWSGPDKVTPPEGRITFLVDAEIPAMVHAATVFAGDLRAAGYWVRLDQESRAQFDEFYIGFGFASDQSAAEIVANYLPDKMVPSPVKQVIGGTQPGEIIINLAAFR